VQREINFKIKYSTRGFPRRFKLLDDVLCAERYYSLRNMAVKCMLVTLMQNKLLTVCDIRG
jgi:hypothetical protein